MKLLVLTVGVLVSICGFAATYFGGKGWLGFTDADIHTQMDIGAYLSFLGYVLVLLGTVLAVIGTSWRRP